MYRKLHSGCLIYEVVLIVYLLYFSARSLEFINFTLEQITINDAKLCEHKKNDRTPVTSNRPNLIVFQIS